jgi:hypothetical protein
MQIYELNEIRITRANTAYKYVCVCVYVRICVSTQSSVFHSIVRSIQKYRTADTVVQFLLEHLYLRFFLTYATFFLLSTLPCFSKAVIDVVLCLLQ